MVFNDELVIYIIDVRSNNQFLDLKGIDYLPKKIVGTKKYILYSFIYFLVTVALILIVATPIMEIVFSIINIQKNRLQNRIEDQRMNDQLLVYIKKDILIALTMKLLCTISII